MNTLLIQFQFFGENAEISCYRVLTNIQARHPNVDMTANADMTAASLMIDGDNPLRYDLLETIEDQGEDFVFTMKRLTVEMEPAIPTNWTLGFRASMFTDKPLVWGDLLYEINTATPGLDWTKTKDDKETYFFTSGTEQEIKAVKSMFDEAGVETMMEAGSGSQSNYS